MLLGSVPGQELVCVPGSSEHGHNHFRPGGTYKSILFYFLLCVSPD